MQLKDQSVASRRLPEWLKVKMPGGSNYVRLRNMLRESNLHTVCEEAQCPNIGDCWDRKSATFMILGDVCTRACTYCAVDTGNPPVKTDITEPVRLAETVESLDLKYVVITSVDRDDLPDGGAFMFAQSIRQIRNRLPDCKVEVLIPDFQGNLSALQKVIAASPDTLNHNIETVRRVFKRVRAKGDYDLSLELLLRSKNLLHNGVTKSGMMVGLGETWDEIVETMKDLRFVECDLLTIGQYIRPSENHVPLSKWYTPAEFDELKNIGLELGFKHVAAGPLVRSSYHADEQYETAMKAQKIPI